MINLISALLYKKDSNNVGKIRKESYLNYLAFYLIFPCEILVRVFIIMNINLSYL